MENTIVSIIKQRVADSLHSFTVFRDLPSEVSQLLIGAVDQTDLDDLIPVREVPNLSLDMDNKILFAQEADFDSEGDNGTPRPKAMSEECFIRVMKVYQDRDKAMKEEITLLKSQHNCGRQPGEKCKIGTGDGQCAICKIVECEEQIDQVRKLLETKIEKLSLVEKDIITVRIPSKISDDQSHRIYKTFSQMVKFAGLKIQIVLLPDGMELQYFGNDQLQKVGLQHTPEIRYGQKEQTGKDLMEKYQADPMYPTIEFDEWLISLIHNSGITI